jgi:large repetitive protein
MRKITLMFLMSLISFCAYAQYPEGFEGTWTAASPGLGSYAAGPAGWAVVNSAGPLNTWIQGSGSTAQPAYEGSHSAFLNSENVATGVSSDWLITPATVVPTNGQLRFWSHLFVNADQGTVYKVLVSTTTTAGTLAEQTTTGNFTGTAANWTELEINPSQQSWVEKVVSLSSWVGQTVYIAFVMEGDNGDRWAIDNVNVVSQCLDPTTLGANSIGTTTATLTWANPGAATNFDIEILPLASGATGVPTNTSTTNSLVASSLTENTDYKFYVRANCGNGNTSNWVGPFNFSTVAIGESCGAPIVVSTLPYSTTSNTSNFGDTVDGSPGATGCGTTSPYLNGNDVFYAYTPTTSGNISVDVSNHGTWAGVFVYTSCANVGVSCVGGVSNSSATAALTIPTLAVTAGTTYYIVISTWATPQTTPYTLTIQQVNCAPPVGNTTTSTASSATLSWTNPSGATSWQLVVQSPGAGIPTGAGSTVASNTTTVSATTPANVAFTSATAYEYYVRADCGNGTFSAWAGPYSFMTTQVPADMPIAETWETGSTNGWSLSNGTQTNKWVYGTATSNSPTHSVYISNDNGVTNAYNNGSISVVHMYRDINIPAGADQATLQFDWKNLGETGWDYIRVWMVPTSFAPTTGTQITAATDRVWLAGAVNLVGNASWTTNTSVVSVAGYAGQARRLVFEWRNDGSGGSNPPAAIDNINFSVITCPQPTALTLGATTDSQATFNWTAPTTPPASYDYYFSTTNTAPTASTTPTGNTTTTSNTQSGLTPSTAYYFWVRSHCSDSDVSLWTGPVSFTTPQIPATLPVAENWESGSTNGWTLSNGTQTNKWVYGTATSNSPTHSIYVSNDNGVTNAYTNTASSVVHAYRDLSIPTGTTDVSVSFDWKNIGETGWDYVRVWLVPATWTPTVGTQITAATDRIQLGGNFVGNASWTTFNNIQSWATYAGGLRRIVFEWRNDGIIGTNPPGAIDNINISVITCPQPISLTATNIGQTSATLGWTNVGTATQWEYYITETPATAPTAATVGVITSDSTPDVTLESATQYSYWVRAVCSDTDKSFWSGPYTFNTTLCETTDQCNYTFILTDSWGDGWNGNTMTVSQNGIPVTTFGSTFTTGTGPVTITVPMCNDLPFQLYWNSGGSFPGEVGVSVVNGFNQTLYSKPAGTGSQNTLLYTGEIDCDEPACLPPTGVTVTDETTTSISVTWALSAVVGATYEVYYVNQGGAAPGETPTTNVVTSTTNSATIEGLDASTTYDIYVRTICSATSNSIWSPVVTHETDPLCPEPIDLEVTCLSTTGASLEWTADGAETSWEVVVQPATAPIPTTGTVVTAPIYLAEGLVQGTVYTAYVRAVCPDVDGYSSWATVNFTTNVGPGDAEPFCAGSVSVPNSTGVTGYGSIGCLGSTPNPIWYYLTVDDDDPTTGGTTMNFTLTQVSNNGTPIDVDFAAFGPFTSALDACSQIELVPGANPLIVACSYSASATEIFTIPNVQDGQVYALLLTNFNGQAGNITLTQTNATTPGAPVTSCDPVVELGNNQTLCATDSTTVTAQVSDPEGADTYTYVWYMDGEAFEPTIVETTDDSQTIEVSEAGQHIISVVVTTPDSTADDDPITDVVTITLSPAFTAPTPAPVTLCGATGTADLDLSAIDFLGSLDPAGYEVLGVYASQANAQSGTNPIDTTVPYNTGSTTLYVAIGDSAVPTCFQIVQLAVTVNTSPDATITYADSPFCSDETTGTVTQTGSAGGVYTSTNGLVVDAVTGTIDVAASEPGTYTVTYTIAAAVSCPEFVTTAEVVVVAAPEATIAYDNSPYCSNAGVATVTFTGTEGGTYTSTGGLVIDAATGEIDLAASTAGTYDVTYTIADTGDCAGISVTTSVTITALPTAAISYDGTPYCSNAGVATVTFAGTGTGGTYTATDGLIIDATTGEIDLAANAAGTYTVTYTIAAANGCEEVTATAEITITELPLAGFSYAYTSVCQNAGIQQVQLAPGAVAGTYTAAVAGLAIDTATGAITPADSQPGIYVVTNTIAAANGCEEVTATFTIEVTPAPVPTFAYAAVAYCQDEATNPLPVLDGASGTFTAPAGLSINAATGEINLAASTPGTYTVTNTITGSDSCPTVIATTEVTITSLPVIALEQGCLDNLYSVWVNFDNDNVYSQDNVTIEWSKNGVVVANTALVVLGGEGPGAGTYDVTVTPNDGAVCPSVGQIVVEAVNCITPKGISPNADGKNDTWDLTGFNVRKVEIFNRYGKEVFSFTGNYTDQFAGIASNGEKLPSGTYYYMFERTDGTTETGWVYVNWEQ